LDNQLNLFIFYSHIAKDQEKSSYQLRLIEGNSINDMAYHNKLQLAKIYGDLQDDKKAISLYQQLITINQSSEILERLLDLFMTIFIVPSAPECFIP
jgi:hypothetical protein